MELHVKSIAKGRIIATCIPFIANNHEVVHELDLVLPCSLDSRIALDSLSFANQATTAGSWCFVILPSSHTVELVNSLHSSLFRQSRQNPYLLCTFLFV